MKIFQDFPFLRQIVGDYGGDLKKVRPINSRMKGFLDFQDSDCYLVMDTEGWRRELAPLTIDTIDKWPLGVTLRFDGFRHYGDYKPIGLAFFDRGINAWVTNPFPQMPERVIPEYTLQVDYTLDRTGDDGTYFPYEDLEYENLRRPTATNP